MRLEAVIVCKDYSDFLEETLPRNLQHLDHVVVVTHPDDKRTISLCKKHGIGLVKTEVMHHGGAPFNKGRAIRLGMSHLCHDGWLIHMDADTLLPDRFRNALQQSHLQKDCIYGADRLNVKNYESWKEHKNKRRPQWQHGCLLMPTEQFPLGVRLVHGIYGYCPIGYFQMWHASNQMQYPINQGSAEHTDVLFAVQWPREKRVLLPEVFVYHLESEQSQMGANWKGRKTKPFKSEKPYTTK